MLLVLRKGAESISAYLGKQGKGLVLNVADQDSIDAVLSAIKAEVGDVEILVNNAGITRDGLLMRMKDDDWFDMQTNLTSIYRLSKAVLRPMMKKGGRIINIGSVVGSMGVRQTNLLCGKSGCYWLYKIVSKRSCSKRSNCEML